MILSIDEIRDKIRPICEKYKIEKVWLFGSYARGEAREDSDVDVHMEVPKGIGLFGLGGIYAELPEENKIFKKYVEREEILLYDRQREGCADPANYRKAL